MAPVMSRKKCPQRWEFESQPRSGFLDKFPARLVSGCETIDIIAEHAMSWYGNLEEAVSKHDGRSRIVKNIKTLTLLFTEAWYTTRQGKVLEGARPWCHRIGRRGQFVCRDNACGRSEAAESL